MGWSLPGQYSPWVLGPYRHARPHQFVGISGRPPLTPYIFAPAAPTHSAHTYRLCHWGSAYQYTEGHLLHTAERLSGTAVDVGQTRERILSCMTGQDNLLANFLLRGRVLSSEWLLHPTGMGQFLRAIGQFVVGLLASALNARLPRYCSRV